MLVRTKAIRTLKTIKNDGVEEIVGFRQCAPSRPSTAIPVVDIPISREELTEADLIVPIWSEFTDAVKADYELHIYKQWLETDQDPTSAASESFIAQTVKLQEQHIKIQLVRQPVQIQTTSSHAIIVNFKAIQRSRPTSSNFSVQ